MDSIELTDQQSAAVATAPRVSLKDIEDAILDCVFLDGRNMYHLGNSLTPDRSCSGDDFARALENVASLTVCVIVMRNGFSVIGKSAPASPENYNEELGRKFAYEDAIRQLWPLMGFALRDRLATPASKPVTIYDPGIDQRRNATQKDWDIRDYASRKYGEALSILSHAGNIIAKEALQDVRNYRATYVE